MATDSTYGSNDTQSSISTTFSSTICAASFMYLSCLRRLKGEVGVGFLQVIDLWGIVASWMGHRVWLVCGETDRIILRLASLGKSRHESLPNLPAIQPFQPCRLQASPTTTIVQDDREVIHHHIEITCCWWRSTMSALNGPRLPGPLGPAARAARARPEAVAQR